ncbi:Hypothetical protein NTJ_06507 [Nesidiocoris tenuis]|uniref:Prisilkin-39-like n=1 Tax=Nesidiocoris tenuis TaxID=355587 RepID=A0ABN7AP11_9HEMI|nr:Hypothetical protein NTJ_06507 [Nesidiocoris tenuis]
MRWRRRNNETVFIRSPSTAGGRVISWLYSRHRANSRISPVEMSKLAILLVACVSGLCSASPPGLGYGGYSGYGYGGIGSYGRSYGYDLRSPHGYSYSSYNLHPTSYVSSYGYPSYSSSYYGNYYGLDDDYDLSYYSGGYGKGLISGYGYGGYGGYRSYGAYNDHHYPYYLKKL